ncbi:unnamed protein product [Dicrocoelium dendriticum]|nr:unnamed protein product [Dicrocoelium dendriticum]
MSSIRSTTLKAPEQTLFTFLDIDEDGSISRREYEIALCLSSERSVDWGAIFDALDLDRSGDISVEEIKRVFNRVRMPILTPGIMSWISEYDVNKDGKLDYKEFLAFIKKGKAAQTWET